MDFSKYKRRISKNTFQNKLEVKRNMKLVDIYFFKKIDLTF